MAPVDDADPAPAVWCMLDVDGGEAGVVVLETTWSVAVHVATTGARITEFELPASRPATLPCPQRAATRGCRDHGRTSAACAAAVPPLCDHRLTAPPDDDVTAWAVLRFPRS